MRDVTWKMVSLQFYIIELVDSTCRDNTDTQYMTIQKSLKVMELHAGMCVLVGFLIEFNTFEALHHQQYSYLFEKVKTQPKCC